MKKKRNPLKPTILPFGFIDASVELDEGKILLISELLSGFTDDNIVLEIDTIQALGRELHSYLRARNALEVVGIGRMPRFYDDEFDDLVRHYRKKLSADDDGK